MKELLDSLIEKSFIQREALIELLEVLRDEKDALRNNKSDLLPGLLERLQDVSSKAMLAEAERTKAAGKLAQTLGCNPVVREICDLLDSGDADRLKASAGDLLATVVSIKEINFILSKQAEEYNFLAEMTLKRLKGFIRPGKAAATLDTTA